MNKYEIMKKIGEFYFELNQCVYDVDEDIMLEKIENFVKRDIKDDEATILCLKFVELTHYTYKLEMIDEIDLDNDRLDPIYTLLDNIEQLILHW